MRIMQRPVKEPVDSVHDFTGPITEEIKNEPDEPASQQLSEVKQYIKFEPLLYIYSTEASIKA